MSRVKSQMVILRNGTWTHGVVTSTDQRQGKHNQMRNTAREDSKNEVREPKRPKELHVFLLHKSKIQIKSAGDEQQSSCREVENYSRSCHKISSTVLYCCMAGVFSPMQTVLYGVVQVTYSHVHLYMASCLQSQKVNQEDWVLRSHLCVGSH